MAACVDAATWYSSAVSSYTEKDLLCVQTKRDKIACGRSDCVAPRRLCAPVSAKVATERRIEIGLLLAVASVASDASQLICIKFNLSQL